MIKRFICFYIRRWEQLMSLKKRKGIQQPSLLVMDLMAAGTTATEMTPIMTQIPRGDQLTQGIHPQAAAAVGAAARNDPRR
jgi:hypothetical protein